MRTTRVMFLILLGFALPMCAVAQPTTAPSPLLAKAIDAVEGDDLKAFAADMDDAANLLLDLWGTSDRPALVEHAVLRRFAHAFTRVGTISEENKQTLRWLLDQPALLRTLMLAMSDSDAPDRMLEVLAILHRSAGDAAAAHPDLTTAFCVVWDDPARSGVGEDAPLDADRIASLFNFYATGPFANGDLLPWDLLVFVVSNPAGETDIAWARAMFPNGVAVDAAFFELRYAWPDLDRSLPPDDERAYTLANLRLRGGLCTDRAYYASVIGQSLGIPAVICTGAQGFGEPRAWVASFRTMRGRGEWDVSARYPEHADMLGRFIEPQTDRPATDGDLFLIAAAANAPADDRTVSRALTALVDAAPMDRRLPLLQEAIDICPGNRFAWFTLADLAAREQLPLDDIRGAELLILRQLLPASPAMAYSVIHRMIEEAPPLTRLEKLDALAPRLAAYPSLSVMVRLEQVDLLLDARRDAEALDLLASLLDRPADLGAEVIPVLARVDELLRAENDLQRLADTYGQVWAALPRPRPGPHVGTLPYVAVGRQYANILRELDQPYEADNVERQANTVVSHVVRP